jgi:hypothetical protein
MKRFKTTYCTSLWTVMLLATFWSLAGSECALGASLKIGDNYGGGKIALILQPGDPGYADLAEHFIVVAKTDISETEELPDAKEAADSIEETSLVERYLQNNIPSRQVAEEGYEPSQLLFRGFQ